MLSVTIVTASDLNPKYLQCVPFFIRFWLTQQSEVRGVKFVPKVILVASELPEELSDFADYCELFESTLPSSFVAQNVRSLIAGFQDSDLVATSDIDMFPLTTRVFDFGLRTLSSPKANEFVVLRDVLPHGQYPICYSLAAPATWAKVFEMSDKNQIHHRLKQIFSESVDAEIFDGAHGGHAWFTDQEFLFTKVKNSASQSGLRIIPVLDDESGHRRLDRYYHRGFIKWMLLPLVNRGYFSDYHVHHPVKKNYLYIEQVLRRVERRTAQLRSVVNTEN